MSSAERFVRHHKRQVDCAISQAYVRLRMDACARSRFADLLHCVRSHAPRFHEARVENGRHPAIEGLVNLARFGQAHLRPAGGWAGSTGSWHAVTASLAQHLLGRYGCQLLASRVAWHHVHHEPSADCYDNAVKEGFFATVKSEEDDRYEVGATWAHHNERCTRLGLIRSRGVRLHCRRTRRRRVSDVVPRRRAPEVPTVRDVHDAVDQRRVRVAGGCRGVHV